MTAPPLVHVNPATGVPVSENYADPEDVTLDLNGGTLTGTRLIDAFGVARASAASLPYLIKKLSNYLTAPSDPFTLVGFGSSVGNGPTLPSPATQAPSAYLKAKLQQTLDPAGLRVWEIANRSGDGTTVTQFSSAYSSMVVAAITPTGPVLLTYGMNDGAVAQFNSGQTLNNVYPFHVLAIQALQDLDIDVIVATTPHPHSQHNAIAMPDGINQSYPTSVTAPTPEQLIPPASASLVTGDFAGNGEDVTVSERYLLVNQSIRRAAAYTGAVLLDVEPYWFRAIQKYGEDALYNVAPDPWVHPNLLGHQVSYHAAIDDFCFAVSQQTQQPGYPRHLAGKFSVNLPAGVSAPGASWEVHNAYSDVTSKPLSVKAPTGANDGNGIPAQVEHLHVDPTTGRTVASGINLTGGVRNTLTTPASAAAAGVAGTAVWDANFIYVCTATNTWKRVAIATW